MAGFGQMSQEETQYYNVTNGIFTGAICRERLGEIEKESERAFWRKQILQNRIQEHKSLISFTGQQKPRHYA